MSTAQNNNNKLQILLVDFSPVVREGLESIISKDDRLEICGWVPDGNEAIRYIQRIKSQDQAVNVVLTETSNNGVDGVKTTRTIKEKYPEVSVIVLTENPNDALVIDAIQAGASGYIFLKDVNPLQLIRSINQVGEGGSQISTALLHQAVDNLVQNGRKTMAERTAEAAHLTAREVDVLRLMGNGAHNKEISDKLGISLDTAKKHVRNIIDKLRARSRTHASIIAAQAGLAGQPINNQTPE